MAKRKITVIGTHMASEEYGVTSVASSGGRHVHRREPCQECPWRKDVPTHVFPAEAFRFSASTAKDMADRTFGCHMSTTATPATCAGFLIANSDNNLIVRLAEMSGDIDRSRIHSASPLYESYREMAVANGVMPDDPALAECRGNGEPHPMEGRVAGRNKPKP